ncbi:MAG: hypothetical protein Q4E37_04370 [Tissierellia bacterium]|nr:hypothetical protein [Tissierellia bacterium]
MRENSVFLKIPAKKKYLSLARLTLSGMAIGERVSIEDLEDVQVLVTESCNLSFKLGAKDLISIEMSLDEGAYSFSVDGIDPEQLQTNDEVYMTSLIIDSLADRVEYKEGAIFVTKELVD